MMEKLEKKIDNLEVQDNELDADAKKVENKDSKEKKEEDSDSENVHISRLENYETRNGKSKNAHISRLENGEEEDDQVDKNAPKKFEESCKKYEIHLQWIERFEEVEETLKIAMKILE